MPAVCLRAEDKHDAGFNAVILATFARALFSHLYSVRDSVHSSNGIAATPKKQPWLYQPHCRKVLDAALSGVEPHKQQTKGFNS